MPQPGTAIVSNNWRAQDVMTRDFTLVPPDASVETALQAFAGTDAQALLVGKDGTYSGLVSRAQIDQAMRSGMTNATLAVLTRDFEHVHPDHRLELVLERLGKNPGILPVVSRNDVHHIQGIVTPQTIMQFLHKCWAEPGTASTNHPEAT